MMLALAPLVVYQAAHGSASTASVITLIVFAAGGLVVGISGIHDFIHAREPQRLRTLATVFAFRGLRWLDLYASADPVSNGALHDYESLRPPQSPPLVNLGSILRDHTAYWDNRDGFVALVAEHLLNFDRPGILPPEDPAVLSFFEAHRGIRVRVLQALRWTTTVSVLALLFTYRADWLQVAAWTSYRVLAWAGSIVGYVPTAMMTPPAPVWSRSVGWLAALLTAAWFTRLWWTRWNRVAMREAQSGMCRAREPVAVLLSGFCQWLLALSAIVPADYAFGVAGVGTLIMLSAVVVLQGHHPVPASRRSAIHPDVPSSAMVAARALGNLLLAAMTAIAAPAAFIEGALWTQAHFEPRVGVRASWAAALLLIALGAIASITAWRQLAKTWNWTNHHASTAVPHDD
jgi:hypothetical protein